MNELGYNKDSMSRVNRGMNKRMISFHLGSLTDLNSPLLFSHFLSHTVTYR